MLQQKSGHLKRLNSSFYGKAAFGIICLALGLRVMLLALGLPEANSDEGAMGVEAIHIAFQHAHPVFLYGQDYMGVLEAYLAAPFFSLFGVSVFTLRSGLLLMFTLFLVCMYCLTSTLYTKKLALLTLLLLGFGIASDVLIGELRAVGGAVETLLFGSLVIVIAVRLALTATQSGSKVRVRRLVLFGCWGLAAGIGIWVHFLVAPFVLMGGLILIVFCYRELLSWAPVVLLAGLLVGASPMIAYNLQASPGHNTFVATLDIHNSMQLTSAQKQDLQEKQLIGTVVWSLPVASGFSPICNLTDLPYYGPATSRTIPCMLVQGIWGVGYVVLLTIASFLAMGVLWKLWRLRGAREGGWSEEERQAAVIHFARLMLLAAVAVTLLLYLISPLSGLKPWSTRYLVGLWVAVPAVLWPLWAGASSGASLLAKMRFSRLLKVSIRGMLVVICLTILAGTVVTFSTILGAEADNAQQAALIHDLLRLDITRVYGPYWTCYRMMFQSQERIICAVPPGLTEVGTNRYAPYLLLVRADPQASYMFPLGTSDGAYDAANYAKKLSQSGQHYRQYSFDGYVVFKPEGP